MPGTGLPPGSEKITPSRLEDSATPLSDYLTAEQLETSTPIDPFKIFQYGEQNHHGRLNSMLMAVRNAVAVVLSGVAEALATINAAVGQAQTYATNAGTSAATAVSAAGTAAANAVAAVGAALQGLVTQAGTSASDAETARAGAEAAYAGAVAISIDDTSGGINLTNKARSADYMTKSHWYASTNFSGPILIGGMNPIDTSLVAVALALPSGAVDGWLFGVIDHVGNSKTNQFSLVPNGTQKICGINDTVTFNTPHVPYWFTYKAAINSWELT